MITGIPIFLYSVFLTDNAMANATFMPTQFVTAGQHVTFSCTVGFVTALWLCYNKDNYTRPVTISHDTEVYYRPDVFKTTLRTSLDDDTQRIYHLEVKGVQKNMDGSHYCCLGGAAMMCATLRVTGIPSQCCLNAGPTSKTVSQH